MRDKNETTNQLQTNGDQKFLNVAQNATASALINNLKFIYDSTCVYCFFSYCFIASTQTYLVGWSHVVNLRPRRRTIQIVFRSRFVFIANQTFNLLL